MLILAGVAISTITTDGGLFDKSRRTVKLYDNAATNEQDKILDLANRIEEYSGESTNSGDTAEPLPIATTVEVGDYVNYDAGTWINEDFTKITSSAGTPTVNKSADKPTAQGEFGGFTSGQSRNTNSKECNSSYKPRTAGWRVWDIQDGVVTLISAGHPETYYHASGSSVASVNILTNRNCSMYLNGHSYATSAKILTGQEAARWYNKQYGTKYTIVENGGSSTSTFYKETFSTAEPISVLENGSYYWLASACSSSYLYCVNPYGRNVHFSHDNAFGVRVLVSLSSEVLLKPDKGDGSVGTPWEIVE